MKKIKVPPVKCDFNGASDWFRQKPFDRVQKFVDIGAVFQNSTFKIILRILNQTLTNLNTKISTNRLTTKPWELTVVLALSV